MHGLKKIPVRDRVYIYISCHPDTPCCACILAVAIAMSLKHFVTGLMWINSVYSHSFAVS